MNEAVASTSSLRAGVRRSRIDNIDNTRPAVVGHELPSASSRATSASAVEPRSASHLQIETGTPFIAWTPLRKILANKYPNPGPPIFDELTTSVRSPSGPRRGIIETAFGPPAVATKTRSLEKSRSGTGSGDLQAFHKTAQACSLHMNPSRGAALSFDPSRIVLLQDSTSFTS